MRIYILIFTCILFSFNMNIFCQENSEILNDEKFNDILLTGVMDIIKEIKDNENDTEFDFNERGYLNVTLLYFNSEAKYDEIMYTFGISDEYLSFEDRKDTYRLLPSKYNIINDKIILYYFPTSKIDSSKRKYFFELLARKSNIEKLSGKIEGFNEKVQLHSKYKLKLKADYSYSID
ncbi:hypothetical protein [Zunongwangia sp. HGR-M22]|uniref:hypothetical protein n=1 Tax=Zunongwangia sp. HGR-M22 TaxID=3015168 RepID=UPI0022DD0234|nr:hypothetical protein [Zunongwangia sp. HGR-M22]WBL27247.1 hypothetical protein PBT91_08210 [Zunongwangia sp. HGR-M22]